MQERGALAVLARRKGALLPDRTKRAPVRCNAASAARCRCRHFREFPLFFAAANHGPIRVPDAFIGEVTVVPISAHRSLLPIGSTSTPGTTAIASA